MSVWTWGWIGLIVYFFAWEIPAVMWERRHGSGATLSAHVRRWFATMSKPRAWRLRRLVLLWGLVWLIVHFFLGW